MEAKQEKVNKSERNGALRQVLKGRTQASAELKHQNISAVLHGMDLPFISGYKPRGNSQLLLRKAVQKFILDRDDLVRHVVDALEEVKAPAEKEFRAVLVDAPAIELVAQIQSVASRVRLPRKSTSLLGTKPIASSAALASSGFLATSSNGCRTSADQSCFRGGLDTSTTIAAPATENDAADF